MPERDRERERDRDRERDRKRVGKMTKSWEVSNLNLHKY